MTRKISIIIPVVRPDLQRYQQYLIHKNAGINKSAYEIIAIEDKDKIGAPSMVAKLTRMANNDLVCFLGDDCRPRYGFLFEALKSMLGLKDGWGVVALNDFLRGKDLAAHFLASKRMLPILGGDFFSPEYRHCFCDWELTDKAKAFGRYVFSHGSVIEHHHPIFKNDISLRDKHYKRAYQKDNIEHDRIIYKKRMNDFRNRYPSIKVKMSYHD